MEIRTQMMKTMMATLTLSIFVKNGKENVDNNNDHHIEDASAVVDIKVNQYADELDKPTAWSVQEEF